MTCVVVAGFEILESKNFIGIIGLNMFQHVSTNFTDFQPSKSQFGPQLFPIFDIFEVTSTSTASRRRLPIMMPETANDTIQIGKDAEVDYSEALGIFSEPMMVGEFGEHN